MILLSSSEISEELLKKYFKITEEALNVVEIVVPPRSHLRRAAEDLLKMARSYFEDAKYFAEKGDYVRAFGCLNYSHAWLDAGVRLGLFDAKGRDDLFTLP